MSDISILSVDRTGINIATGESDLLSLALRLKETCLGRGDHFLGPAFHQVSAVLQEDHHGPIETQTKIVQEGSISRRQTCSPQHRTKSQDIGRRELAAHGN